MPIMILNGRNAYRALALGLGLALAGLVVWTGRVPHGTVPLGAQVSFSVNPTGELAVSRAGTFVQGRDIRPGAGSSAQGSVSVTNQTGGALDVSLRADPSGSDLDSILLVRVLDGSRPVFDGTLGALRASSPPFQIPSGQSAPLTVRAWLPAGAAGYEGRVASVDLQLQSTPSGARG